MTIVAITIFLFLGNNETRERMSAITVRYVLVRVGKRVGATAKPLVSEQNRRKHYIE